MKKFPVLGAIGLAALVTAGCSGGGQPVNTVAELEATTTTSSTTTTTMAPTTTTTVCVVDTAAVASDLRSDQARLDSLISGRSNAESAVAQLQLVVDNAGRSIESHRRAQVSAQTAYNQAAAAFNALPLDSNRDRMVAAADNLADWKGIVASWEALRTKALGDLSRAKATLTDWDKQINDARRAVATAPATLVCS